MKKITMLLVMLLFIMPFAGCGGEGAGVITDEEKTMKIVDLSHVLTEGMSVFPGDEPPTFQTVRTHEDDGYMITQLNIWSQVGTHMDAPAHFIRGGTTLDALPVEQFIGKALIIDCYALGEGDIITMEQIDLVRDKADEAEFLLFCTGWDKNWGTDEYSGEYPYFDEEVLQYIIDSKKKGVGSDTLGPDPVESHDLPNHCGLLENGIVIMENLANLDQCGYDLFTLYALPLKFINADGAPVRAVAIIEE